MSDILWATNPVELGGSIHLLNSATQQPLGKTATLLMRTGWQEGSLVQLNVLSRLTGDLVTWQDFPVMVDCLNGKVLYTLLIAIGSDTCKVVTATFLLDDEDDDIWLEVEFPGANVDPNHCVFRIQLQPPG